MVFLLGVDVFRLVLVVHQQRDRADECFTVGEDVHHRHAVLVKLHSVVHLHPPCEALMVALFKVDAVLLCRLCDAHAVACIPNGRVGNAVYVLVLEPAVLRLDAVYLLEDFVRTPLDARVRLVRHTAIELKDAVDAAIKVNRPPCAGERL